MTVLQAPWRRRTPQIGNNRASRSQPSLAVAAITTPNRHGLSMLLIVAGMCFIALSVAVGVLDRRLSELVYVFLFVGLVTELVAAAIRHLEARLEDLERLQRERAG